jgi:hypothetical protein
MIQIKKLPSAQRHPHFFSVLGVALSYAFDQIACG